MKKSGRFSAFRFFSAAKIVIGQVVICKFHTTICKTQATNELNVPSCACMDMFSATDCEGASLLKTM